MLHDLGVAELAGEQDRAEGLAGSHLALNVHVGAVSTQQL